MITKYTIIAIAIITLVDFPLRILFNKKGYKAGNYLILLTIAILTTTAYYIHKNINSIVTTLLICNFLSLYDTFVSIIAFYFFRKKFGGNNEIYLKDKALFHTFLMIIVSSDSAYAGYILSGGRTSFLMIVLVLFVSISLLAISSWLHFSKRDSEIDSIKRNIIIKMNELNAQDDFD